MFADVRAMQSHVSVGNRHISHSTQGIRQISHNSPFCNTHVHISATKWPIVVIGLVHCGICATGPLCGSNFFIIFRENAPMHDLSIRWNSAYITVWALNCFVVVRRRSISTVSSISSLHRHRGNHTMPLRTDNITSTNKVQQIAVYILWADDTPSFLDRHWPMFCTQRPGSSSIPFNICFIIWIF